MPLPEDLRFLHINPRLPHNDTAIPHGVREDYKRSKDWLEKEGKHRKQEGYAVLEDRFCRFFLEASPSPLKERAYPSLEELLFHLFPNANGDVLEAVVKQGILGGKEVVGKTSKVTDESYTGVVFSINIDGRRVYCKVSSEGHLIAREAQYLTDAWSHPLLRPITPKMLGVFEVPGAAGILTYGTENEGIVAKEDMCAYRELRRRVFFACKHHPEINIKDPVLIDVFNRALTHTLLSAHQENPLYHTHTSPLIVPFEMLVERASVIQGRLFLDLMSLRETYEYAAKKYTEGPSLVLAETLVHFDARQENIFPSAYQALRPLGDPAFARVGSPEYDIARLESGRDEAYVRPYLFFREKIAQEVGANHEEFIFDPALVVPFQKRVRALSFLFATRTFSSKLSRSVFEHGAYYRDLAFRLKGSYVK